MGRQCRSHRILKCQMYLYATKLFNMTNKELVKTAITEAFINRDKTAIDKYWSDQYIQHNPQVPNGREGLKQLFGLLGPEFKYDIGLIVADGDFVMVHGRYMGFGP